MKRVLILLASFLLFVGYVSAQAVSNPGGIAVDSAGNRYLADTGNNRIIKIDSSGASTVFAGSGTAGLVNGIGIAAQFNQPSKIMIDPTGNFLYVADTGNHAIRKISLISGAVTTVAGNGTPGSTNGPISVARFNSPKGLFVTTLGEVIVADTGNHLIRRISESQGQVMNIIGTGSPGSVSCNAVSCPPAVTQSCSLMALNSPQDVVISTVTLASSNPTHYYDMYVADTGNHGIRAVRYEVGTGWSTFACDGRWVAGTGSSGYSLGASSQFVAFNNPVAVDAFAYINGQPSVSVSDPVTMWVVDKGNNVVRYLSNAQGFAQTTPFAGIPQSAGLDNGAVVHYIPGTTPAQSHTAKLDSPSDVFVKANSAFEYSSPYQFYVADSGNNRLRKLDDANSVINNGVWVMNWVPISLTSGPATNTCPNANDVILRLSSDTNAHGEVYNGASNYPVEVCYSTTFGVPVPTTAPDRSCSPSSEKVVGLSSATNAHGEIPENNNYATNICYEGLSCYSVSGSANCNAGDHEILHLDGPTNAHMEIATGTAYVTSGDSKICCSNAPANQIGPANWRDFNNQPFSPPNSAGNPVCINQFVTAHAQANGFPNAVQGAAYELWENDGILPDDCIAGFSSGCPGVPGSGSGVLGDISGGETSIQFQLTSGMFTASGESNPEFYFKVYSVSPVTMAQSGILHAVDNPAQCQTQPPTASITAPVHQGVYFSNTNINFTSGCSSGSENLNYSWEITQGGSQVQTSTQSNFQFSFANTGQALVKLTCTGVVSGLSATAESQILIVSSPFTFAYINAPGLNSVWYNPIQTGQPYFAEEVPFSASESFALDTNIQGNNCVVNCLAGICPAQTQNSPSSCIGNVPGSPSNGQSGGALVVTGTPAPYANLNFDWTFWDNNWNNPWTSNEGAGAHSGTVVYDDLSNVVNDKKTNITATYSSGGVTATANFQREFTLGRCLNNGNTYLHPSNGPQTTTGINAVLNACRGGDNIKLTEDDCCPGIYLCDEDPNTQEIGDTCILPSTTADSCDDLVNEDDCNNWMSFFNLQTLINSQGGTVPACTTLKCLWVISGSNPNTCQTETVSYQQSGNNGCDPTLPCTSSCTWTTNQPTCENGQKTISFIGTVTGLCGNTNCTRAPITVPCGGLNFELGFFDYIQFIAAGITIALIYTARSIGKKR